MTKPPSATLSVHLPASYAAQLRQLADAGDRSVSSELRRAVRAHLERTAAAPSSIEETS